MQAGCEERDHAREFLGLFYYCSIGSTLVRRRQVAWSKIKNKTSLKFHVSTLKQV
jgi:hypothetical protein